MTHTGLIHLQEFKGDDSLSEELQLFLRPGASNVFHNHRPGHCSLARYKNGAQLPRSFGVGQPLSLNKYRRVQQYCHAVPFLRDSR